MRKLVVLLFYFLLPVIIYCQEKRVALVIGNSNYQNAAPLANPENDAEDIGEKLKTVGFEVSRHLDLNQTEMKKVIDEFGLKLDKADIGLFFYAGHGVQAKGKNYLIPIDAALKTENDVEDNCVDAGRILAKMEDVSTSTNIVILDACRNNPFERSWSRNSNGNGLAPMDAPSGSLIAYSTAAGRTASDGYYRNSPFTAGLLEYIGTPNLNIEALFKLVRIKVMDNTNGQQVPWESSSLTGDFYFNADQTKTQTTLNDILPAYKENSIESTDYETLRQSQAAGIRSLAVMPFANYTGDESNAYLASGMHDAVITELGQLSSVRVISKTSTLKYADFQNTIKEIATELDVDGIIETSIISLGEDLRIQVKLFSAFPQEQMLWSEVFTSDMSDILNLYNRVTKNIADEIQLLLTKELKSKLEGTIQKINPEAYNLYLRGRYFWHQRTEEDTKKSMNYFNQAIKLDTNFALAYTGLAEAYLVMGWYLFYPRNEAFTIAKKYAKKALSINNNIAEAHVTLGMFATWREKNWQEAEKEFKLAISLNPNYYVAHQAYFELLDVLGRSEEAGEQINLAIKYNPNFFVILYQRGRYYYQEGKYDSAIEQYKEVLEIRYHYNAMWGILRCYLRLGKDKEAIEQIRDIISKNTSKNYNILLDEVYRESGIDGVIYWYIDWMLINEPKISHIASLYALIGDSEKAIEYLEKGVETDALDMFRINIEPDYNILKTDPRFIALVKKMGL